MAIGDKLPDIFGGLAQSVLKADGPMYFMDLFEGRDADREMNLRMGIDEGGAPMPMDGLPLDNYTMMTQDPNMGISMVIDDALATMGGPGMGIDNMKAEATAMQLFDRFPGTIDPSLLGEVSEGIGISQDDLATAYNSINANVQLDMVSGASGEGLFNPLGPPDVGRDPREPEPPQDIDLGTLFGWDTPVGRGIQGVGSGLQALGNIGQDIGTDVYGWGTDWPKQYEGPLIPTGAQDVMGSILPAIGDITGVTDPDPHFLGIPFTNRPELAARGSITEGRPLSIESTLSQKEIARAREAALAQANEAEERRRLANQQADIERQFIADPAVEPEPVLATKGIIHEGWQDDPGYYSLPSPFAEKYVAPIAKGLDVTARTIAETAKFMHDPTRALPTEAEAQPLIGLPELIEDYRDNKLNDVQRYEALQNIVLGGMDKSAAGRFAEGDPRVIQAVDRQVAALLPMFDLSAEEVKSVEADTNIFSGTGSGGDPSAQFQQPATAPQPFLPSYFQGTGGGGPGQQFGPIQPFQTPTVSINDVPMSLSQATYGSLGTGMGSPVQQYLTGQQDPGTFPGSFTGMSLRDQYSTYMQNLPDSMWGLPGYQSAAMSQFQPTRGLYALDAPQLGSEDRREQFGEFLQDIGQGQSNVLNWQRFAPQWNWALDYLDAKQSGDIDRIEKLSGNLQMSGLITALDPREGNAKSNAISLALARWHAGRPATSSYANRAVASVMEDIYDRESAKAIQSGGNATAAFLQKLERDNPERFGRS